MTDERRESATIPARRRALSAPPFRLWLALLVIVSTASSVLASGPFPLVARFWQTYRPNPPIDDFLAGELGILDRRMHSLDLFVAYRYLNDLEVGEEARMAIRQKRAPRSVRTATFPLLPTQQWHQARRRAVGGSSSSAIWNTSRRRTVTTANGTRSRFYRNCLDDAFLVAARTLEERVEHYGQGAPEVERWVQAQDLVFANCTGGESIPPAASSDWDPLAKLDREYQIAAATFYSEQLEAARRRFDAIASDPASPWRHFADHVVARTWIRESSFSEGDPHPPLVQARERLEAILANPDRASVEAGSRRLLQYVMGRLDPEQERERLARRLLAPQLTATVTGDLRDLQWLGGGDVLSAWIATSRLPRGHAQARQWLDQYADRESVAWLLAELWHAPAGGDGLDDLLQRAAAVDPTSPGYLSVLYQRTTLLRAVGHAEEVNPILDQLLSRSEGSRPLSLGDRNRLRRLRAVSAPTLADFADHAPMTAVEVGYADGSRAPLFGVDRVPAEIRDQPMLDPALTHIVNRYLSARQLLKMLDALPSTAARLSRRIAISAWARAALLQDDVALALSSRVEALTPELATEMRLFRAAEAGEARLFAAALAILRRPGLRPFLHPVERTAPLSQRDSARDNWWCNGESYQHVWDVSFDTRESVPAPSFPTTAERSATEHLWQELISMADTANLLGPIVLEWADQNRRDGRVPEALHRLVVVTRYGCRPPDTGEVSKAAFQRLHSRYPQSEWTKKTPHWFR